jgi:TPR repeat protein
LLHYDGAGVARDPIKAADWFREAAIQGDANAQYNLGVLYEKGLGVRQDDVRALLWYHSAAEQSHPVAQLNLGTLYAEGRGIPLSYEEARRWFQAAAENGVAAGYYNLGVLAEMGLGGRPDEPAALDLYRLAAEMGHSGAAARLAHEAADPDAVKPSDMQLAKTLGLERTERLDIPVVVEIQARLGRLGVYSGRIDGVAGPRTREAIRDYEAAKGLPVTGSPSDALLRHLREATDPIAGTPPVTG